jgi:hypothetical protein
VEGVASESRVGGWLERANTNEPHFSLATGDVENKASTSNILELPSLLCYLHVSVAAFRRC